MDRITAVDISGPVQDLKNPTRRRAAKNRLTVCTDRGTLEGIALREAAVLELNSFLILSQTNSLNSETEMYCSFVLKTLLDTHHLVPKTLEKVSASLKALSHWYLGEKTEKQSISKDEAIAYALYFGVTTFGKSHAIATFLKDQLSSVTKARILDLGTGTGAALQGILTCVKNPAQLTAVEISPAMQEVARKLLPSGTIFKNSIEQLNQNQKYDLIIAANLCNELEDSEAYVEQMDALLNKEGILFIMEPGTKVATRGLMQIRDCLVAKEYVPLFPCPHRFACPMLPKEQDWCHGTLRWNEPPLLIALDRELGFSKHRLKYSAFVGRKQ